MTTATESRTGDVDKLLAAWTPPPGIKGFLTQVNHRAIGKRYIVTSLVFFVLAGLMALAMRVQLAQPELNLISPAVYNQLFTLHGSAMMFLFAVPIMEGIGIYLVPLMVGARDMAFPKLNALGYWVFLMAGVVLFGSFLFLAAPDGGWFNYVPLTDDRYSPGIGIDFWTAMITFIEVAALTAAVELIVTILKLRAPGMSINRMPLFVWAILVMSIMIVFAMPSLIVASVLLALDRTVSTQFFNTALGGDPLLWQHLFWFFGHPEVYIILVPALGIVSTIIATFSRRPVLGYTWLVLSLVFIGIVSFGLWVHHMFATGVSVLGMNFFTVGSILITIPSGIQFFAWIATLWTGRVLLRTPMLWVLGFFVIFLLGGITGVMIASVPFDWQTHDTHFIVAHFHYVLIGGAVFPLFGGLHYWWPKITGRMPSEALGQLSFWLTFIGFNMTFFIMHLTGMLGMPRRVYTYPEGLGWELPNLISSAGAFVLGLGFAVMLFNLLQSALRGEPAGNNPWAAGTLEWATTSPPPQYNFRTFTDITSREPLWDGTVREQTTIGVVDLDLDRRETVVSSVFDARPTGRVVLPAASITPLLLAIAVMVPFLGVLIDLILVPIGAVLAGAAMVAWNWPRKEQRERHE